MATKSHHDAEENRSNGPTAGPTPEGEQNQSASEDLISAGPDKDPVWEAYARTGRADTSGISGLAADDEDAGEERRKLYKNGAELVSRID